MDLIETHLGASHRARHSMAVGFIMQAVAEETSEDPQLWELVGLCHDLDFEVTCSEPRRHGIVAAEWLATRLPEPALAAIRSHDHRTGVLCETTLCHALKLADSLAVVSDRLGRSVASSILVSADAPARLAVALDNLPYLPSIIVASAARLDIPLAKLADILRAAPSTSQSDPHSRSDTTGSTVTR